MRLTLKKSTQIFILLLMFSAFASGQMTDQEKAIALYEKGEYNEAVQVLKSAEDGVSLYYLGLSLEKLKRTSEAKNAFEKSLVSIYEEVTQKLRDRLAQSIVEEKEKFSGFFSGLRSKVEIGINSAKKATEYNSKKSKTNGWKMKASSLFEINKLFESKEILYAYDEVDKDIKIIKAPSHRYSESARRSNVEGTVLTFAVFDSDGKTILVAPIKYLTNGLTEGVIIATKKIEFEPAVKNGKPVSIVKFLQHRFSIH